MAKKRETLFKEKVLRDLENARSQGLPVQFTKIQQVAIRGTPDILVCLAGRYIALELKSTITSRISKLQLHQGKKLADAGGVFIVVHPGNWEKVLNAFSTLVQGHEDVIDALIEIGYKPKKYQPQL